MTPGARLAAAIEILTELDGDGRPADRVVDGYFRQRRYAGSKDRAAVSGRVYDVLRRRRRLSWWIAKRSTLLEPTPRLLVLTDAVLGEASGPKMVLDHLTGERHAPEPPNNEEHRYLSSLAGEPLSHGDMPAGVAAECPDWMVPRLMAALGGGFAATMASMLTEAPFDIRLNPAQGLDRDALRDRLAKEGLATEPAALSPIGLRSARRRAIDGLAAFKDGRFEVQDEGAQIAALLVGAKPGMQVADYCAGAGGKTLVLAGMMEQKGRVLATDTSEGRLERCGVRSRRAGLHNVERLVLDEKGNRRIKRLRGKFDRVLVDAPCTGVGTWRRNPDARWRYGESDLAEMTAQQDQILGRAARLVAPGGRLVYVTCSLLAEENEARVEAFLEGTAGFRPMRIEAVWEETVTALGGPPAPVAGTTLRLTPDAHGTDGFFVAVLERVE